METVYSSIAPDFTALPVPDDGSKRVISPLCDPSDPDGNMSDDPITAFRDALSKVGRHLAAQGAAPPHLKQMVFYVPDFDAFTALLPDFDLTYREVFAGNFTDITVVEDKDLSAMAVQAAAIIPPSDPTRKVYGDFTQAEINFQYSPRQQAPNHEEYFAHWRSAGPKFQARRTAEIFFGSSPKESFDLYLPEDMQKAPPFHLFIHGGYWQAMDKAGHSHMATALLDAGVAVAMVNYDLMPEVDLEEIVRQCRSATVRAHQIADEYGIDGDRITVSGHSAGGHLSGVLGCTNWKEFDPAAPERLVKGIVPISGLFDLAPLAATGMNPVLKLTPDVIAEWSPIYMAPTYPLPVVLSAGGDESEEFHRQTTLFADHMAAHGCEVTTVEMPGHNHFSIAEGLCDASQPLTRAILDLIART